jgi:hypothetical protein
MSWRQPRGRSLAELIDKTGLHPVTAITKLTKGQKDRILHDGLILCREVATKQDVLKKAGVHGKKLQQVVAEAEAIVQLKDTV